MKKFLLSLMAVTLCVANVSAKGGSKFDSAVKAVASQDWSVGLRVGSGLQANAECFYGDKTYVEGRFGLGYISGLSADFTALHNWNIFNMDWTPSAGQWFFDAGVGFNIGGASHWVYGGVAGQAKLGIKFSSAPVRLSVDWTPVIGVGGHYGKVDLGDSIETNRAYFYSWGLCNFGITASYCF